MIPDEANLQALEGDILYTESRFDEAAAQYELSVTRAGLRISDVVIKKFKALSAKDDNATAQEYLLAWLRTNPRDVRARMELGGAFSRYGRVDDAASAFIGVLKLQPNNVMALNNLA